MKTKSHTEQTHKTSAWPGVLKFYQQSFQQIKVNWQPAFIFSSVLAVASLLDQQIHGNKGFDDATGSVLKSGAALIFLLFITRYQLNIAKKRFTSISEFFKFELGLYARLVCGVVLSVLVIGLSAIAFLIPLIWTIPWFILTPYVLLDKNLGPIDALKASKDIAENHKGKVWSVMGVGFVLSFITSLLLTIPFFGGVITGLTSVLSGGALAILYFWLRGRA